MQIRFDEIPPQGLAFELKEHSWFPAHDLVRRGPLRASAVLEREGERVVMTGNLGVTVIFSCDRCLEPAPFELESSFKLNLEVGDPQAVEEAGVEHLCRADEMDTVQLAEALIDVGELLTQQLYLSLPAKHLCRPDCQGLCPVCGGDLNRNFCRCARSEQESPFAVLRQLKLKE